MELMEREPQENSNFFARNSIYLKYKTVIFIGIAVLAVILFFIAGYFIGAAKYQSHGALKSIELTAQEEDLPLMWDGVCPKKSSECPPSFQDVPPLLLISLDGFRPDYLNRGYTPTLKNISQCGTSADFMYPVFPTKTFPNHYSIVTGLYPQSHGIIGNTMYDPIKQKLFKIGQPESFESFWWEKEPIWVTAVKQGKKAATFFWPGSDVKIYNTLPTFFKMYNSKIPYEVRVDQISEWLNLPPASRPNFLTLYVNEPDKAGHNYGVHSKQTNEALAKVDRMIARLFSRLQQNNLIDCVNIIIVSDHGMSDVSCKKVVPIQNYINVNDSFITMGALGRVRPKERNTVTDEISKLLCKNKHMRVYRKEQLPIRMHYADNPRIEPIVLDTDAGWTISSHKVEPNDYFCSGGAHGYDNLIPDMRAIFLAHGPSFKKNYSIEPFLNTEVYELLCELIQVVPQPNNGTRGSLHDILQSSPLMPSQFEPDAPATGDIPTDEVEYNLRVNASNCSCAESQKQAIISNVSAIHNLHLPFGVPYSSHDNSTLRLLYNEDYVTAFDLKFHLPMWTAFTLSVQKNVGKFEDICWIGDARIPIDDAPQCTDYNSSVIKEQYILQRPLYPPDFSHASAKEQATFITNSVPKSINHSKILEEKLNEILSEWVREQNHLNVIMGPAFDVQATGIRPSREKIMNETLGPVVVPTHIFVVASWCSNTTISLEDCDPSALEVHSFLLPNHPYPQNCGESAARVIEKNFARVIDVENLAGLSFYTGLPTYDAIRLRTMMPHRSVS